MLSSESVSVILSVENAQSWLGGDLDSLVECLADLSSDFEIVVIDNGSRDSTIEVLEHFGSLYPQIRYRRLAERQPTQAAMQIGVSIAKGDYLFTSTLGARMMASDLRRLWALRSDPRLVVARSQTKARRIDSGLVNRLTQWAQRLAGPAESAENLTESFGGVQMTRRTAWAQLQPVTATARSAENQGNIEISHISHQQLASPKLVEARRAAYAEPSAVPGQALGSTGQAQRQPVL